MTHPTAQCRQCTYCRKPLHAMTIRNGHRDCMSCRARVKLRRRDEAQKSLGRCIGEVVSKALFT